MEIKCLIGRARQCLTFHRLLSNQNKGISLVDNWAGNVSLFAGWELLIESSRAGLVAETGHRIRAQRIWCKCMRFIASCHWNCAKLFWTCPQFPAGYHWQKSLSSVLEGRICKQLPLILIYDAILHCAAIMGKIRENLLLILLVQFHNDCRAIMDISTIWMWWPAILIV